MTAPVTIVTGFLGAGKTTLVNRILGEMHGQRIAVIENEFGEVGVDAEFLAHTGDETIIQLANGCVCCTVRGDLAKALQQLVAQSDAGRYRYDRVLIETSGVAHPGPVVQTFLAETAIRARFHLEGVVTLVDALHGLGQLARVENVAQVACADRLLLSKVDAASNDVRKLVEVALTRCNPRADVIGCDVRTAPIETLLAHVFDTRGFALDYISADEIRRVRASEPKFLPTASAAPGLRDAARHTDDIASLVFMSDVPIEIERLNAVLDAFVARYGERLWRCKGIVSAAHQRPRLIVQGVQRLIQITGGTVWRAFDRRQTTLVFIGEQLDREWMLALLRACEVGSAPTPD